MASETFFVRQRSAPGGLWRQSRGIGYAEHSFGVTSASASVADDDLEDLQAMGASGSKFRGSRSHLMPGQRGADGKAAPYASSRSSDGAWHHNSGSAPYENEVATQQKKLPKVLCARIGMSSSASSFMPRPGYKTSLGPSTAPKSPRLGVGRKPDAELRDRVQSLQEAFACGGSSGSSTGQRLSTGHYRPLRGQIPMATVRVEELAKPRRREPSWSDVGVRSLESLSIASATTLGDGSEEGSKTMSLSRKPRRQPQIPALTDHWQAKLEAIGKAEGYCSNVRPKAPPKKPASKPSRKAKTAVEVDIGEAEIQQMEEEKEETGTGKVPLEPVGAGINAVLDTSVGIAQQQPQQEQPDQAQPKPDEKEKAGLQNTVRFDLPTEASVSEDAGGINDGKLQPAVAGEEASGNRDIDGDVGFFAKVKALVVEGTSEQTSTQEAPSAAPQIPATSELPLTAEGDEALAKAPVVVQPLQQEVLKSAPPAESQAPVVVQPLQQEVLKSAPPAESQAGGTAESKLVLESADSARGLPERQNSTYSMGCAISAMSESCQAKPSERQLAEELGQEVDLGAYVAIDLREDAPIVRSMEDGNAVSNMWASAGNSALLDEETCEQELGRIEVCGGYQGGKRRSMWAVIQGVAPPAPEVEATEIDLLGDAPVLKQLRADMVGGVILEKANSEVDLGSYASWMTDVDVSGQGEAKIQDRKTRLGRQKSDEARQRKSVSARKSVSRKSASSRKSRSDQMFSLQPEAGHQCKEPIPHESSFTTGRAKRTSLWQVAFESAKPPDVSSLEALEEEDIGSRPVSLEEGAGLLEAEIDNAPRATHKRGSMWATVQGIAPLAPEVGSGQEITEIDLGGDEPVVTQHGASQVDAPIQVDLSQAQQGVESYASWVADIDVSGKDVSVASRKNEEDLCGEARVQKSSSLSRRSASLQHAQQEEDFPQIIL